MHRDRGFRRLQILRKRTKFRKIIHKEWCPLHESQKDTEKRIAKMAITPKPNKCQCCCNPRHSIYYNEDTKLTMQERRAKRAAEYEITEALDS